jgi:hypothetical protein
MPLARVNPLSSLTDYSALQDDLMDMALNHPPLSQIAITQERKFLVDSSLAIDALWLTPRNGGQGTGIVIEDIRPVVNDKSDGKVFDLLCGFVILAERNLAMTPDVGCLFHPEQVEAIVISLFNGKVIQPYGQLYAKGQIGGPATDWIDDGKGIYARRVALKILNAPIQTDTCDPLFITNAGGEITLTSGSTADGLQIYYTLDGTFPGVDSKLYPASKLYAAPFTVDPGTTIRAIAYAPDFAMSALKQVIA